MSGVFSDALLKAMDKMSGRVDRLEAAFAKIPDIVSEAVQAAADRVLAPDDDPDPERGAIRIVVPNKVAKQLIEDVQAAGVALPEWIGQVLAGAGMVGVSPPAPPSATPTRTKVARARGPVQVPLFDRKSLGPEAEPIGQVPTSTRRRKSVDARLRPLEAGIDVLPYDPLKKMTKAQLLALKGLLHEPASFVPKKGAKPKTREFQALIGRGLACLRPPGVEGSREEMCAITSMGVGFMGYEPASIGMPMLPSCKPSQFGYKVCGELRTLFWEKVKRWGLNEHRRADMERLVRRGLAQLTEGEDPSYEITSKGRDRLTAVTW
jgi:hypothetical protein